MSKGTETFKKTIQQYLDKRADEDELFAITLKKENKSIDECVNYILSEVQKSGCNGFADEEIFKMAVHYYDEDDIKPGKSNSSMKVVVNHQVELSEDEKEDAKKKGIDLAIQEAKEEAKKNLAQTIQLNDEDVAEARKLAIEEIIDEQKEKIVKKKKTSILEVKTETPSLFD